MLPEYGRLPRSGEPKPLPGIRSRDQVPLRRELGADADFQVRNGIASLAEQKKAKRRAEHPTVLGRMGVIVKDIFVSATAAAAKRIAPSRAR